MPEFTKRPNTDIPNADTIGRGLKELAIKNKIYKCDKSGSTYEFNTAEKLNSLLLEMIKKQGLIKVGNSIDLDFDHQFIPAHKYELVIEIHVNSGSFFYQSEMIDHLQKQLIELFCGIELVFLAGTFTGVNFIIRLEFLQTTSHCV